MRNLEFYVVVIGLATLLSMLVWVVVVYRFRHIYSSNEKQVLLGAFIAKLHIIGLDALLLWAIMVRPETDTFRMLFSFIMGLQLTAAVTLATSARVRKK